jgi:hypothetical protein
MMPVEIQNLHCGCSHRVHRHRQLAYTDESRTSLSSGPCCVVGCGCEGLFSQPYPSQETVSWAQESSPFENQIIQAKLSTLLVKETENATATI